MPALAPVLRPCPDVPGADVLVPVLPGADVLGPLFPGVDVLAPVFPGEPVVLLDVTGLVELEKETGMLELGAGGSEYVEAALLKTAEV